jgi:hypothetical protein
VIHVTEPLNRRNSGVVRTTSPVAPSLMIKTFILGQSIFWSRRVAGMALCAFRELVAPTHKLSWQA